MRLLFSLFLLIVLFFCPVFADTESPASDGTNIEPASKPSVVASPSPEDIQWFRDKLQISEKYKERETGILGLSWAHFLSMVFLVVFFIGALTISVLRARRTREILEALMKEKDLKEGRSVG